MKKQHPLESTKKAKFSSLFDTNYKRLYHYAFSILKNEMLSEELVQETFIKLWDHFNDVKDAEPAIVSFLFTTLKNKIIDDFRKRQTREKHHNLYNLGTDRSTDIEQQWQLLEQIEEVYTSLEAKTEAIFKLSREKGLTYKEISTQKNISVKTVEHHISKALEAFRKGLKDYF
ncbi:sigma-70 family RNA polymerase sigma factor [Wenyingzhuangia sp. IMCC45533]